MNDEMTQSAYWRMVSDTARHDKVSMTTTCDSSLRSSLPLIHLYSGSFLVIWEKIIEGFL